MYKPNKELQNAINVLYEFLKNENYGKSYSWHELSSLAGFKTFNSDNIYYVANRVCLMLMRNDKRYLQTVHGVGKRLINPNEHQLFAKKTANKSVKIYKKAGAILASTNMDELNDDQKREVIEAANKYTTLEMFTQEMLSKKRIGVSGKSDVRTASLFLDTIKAFSGKD